MWSGEGTPISLATSLNRGLSGKSMVARNTSLPCQESRYVEVAFEHAETISSRATNFAIVGTVVEPNRTKQCRLSSGLRSREQQELRIEPKKDCNYQRRRNI